MLSSALQPMNRCTALAARILLWIGFACFSSSASAVTVGAYYYPWWGQGGGGHSFAQTLRDRLPAQNQMPLIGEYDNRDLWTTAAHIDQSQAANVSMWSLSWWGPNSFEDNAIRNHVLSNPLASRLSFTIHYESTGRLGTFVAPDYSNLIPDFRHLAENVFSDPNYLRIGDRPVVMIYLSRVYFDDPAGWSALSDLRTAMQNEYGFDPYIVGDHFFNTMAAGAEELDAVTSFDTYGQAFSNGVTPVKVALLAHRYGTASTAAENAGVDFIPGISPGYNDRGVRLEADHDAAQRYFDGENPSTAGTVFHSVIESAALPYLDADVNDLVLINSFNEWHEDTQIEASAVSGFTNVDNSPSGSDYTQGKSYEGYGATYLDILRVRTGGPPQYRIYNGLFGDVNQDGVLDHNDAEAFRSAWATTRPSNAPLRDIVGRGDWDLDGITLLPDAFLLRSALREAGHDLSLEQLVPSLLTNGGFESPDLEVVNGGNPIRNGWDAVPDVPAWNSDGMSTQSGIQPGGPLAAGTPEGSQVALLSSNDPSVYQTTEHAIQQGKTFTLQFSSASFAANATLEASIYFVDGQSRTLLEMVTLSESDDTHPLSRSQWNFYTLTASVDSSSAALGHQVGVEFRTLVGIAALDGVVLWSSTSMNDGDFDDNGLYNCADIDALVAQIAGGSHSTEFDLNGDGSVDNGDVTAWLSEAGASNLGTGHAYLPGDANLDGVVDVSDFNLWNRHRFVTGVGWCGADFSADGSTDVSDFNIWNFNKFRSSEGVVVVPEPTLPLLLIVLLGIAAGRCLLLA